MSVIVPAYNSADFIATTLDSVFAQTFTDFEVIVVNDGSSDTPALERALRPYRDRIEYLTQENRGPSSARNRGITVARGQFVALLDSDDQWLPGFLTRQLACFRANPALDLVYCNGVIVGGPLDGRPLLDSTAPEPHVTADSLITESTTVLTSCTVARRQALIDVGLFDERYRRSEDAHLWLRLALRGGRIASIPEVLVRHRRRSGSLSHDTVAMLTSWVAVLEDVSAHEPCTPEQQRLIARQVARRRATIALERARHAFLERRYGEAAGALSRARELEPTLSQRVRFAAMAVGMRLMPRVLHRVYARRHRALASAA